MSITEEELQIIANLTEDTIDNYLGEKKGFILIIRDEKESNYISNMHPETSLEIMDKMIEAMDQGISDFPSRIVGHA